MSRMFLFSLLLLAGCTSIIKPEPIHVLVPAQTSYDAIFALEVGLASTEDMDTKPTPAPQKVKEGDKCPHCKGTGKLDGDGTVRPECWQCLGDGIANKNDPILTNPGEYVITIFGELVENIKSELKKIPGEDFEPVPPPKEEEPAPAVPPRKQYKDVTHFYIFKDNDYYFWNERLHSFISKSGVTIPTPTVGDISSTKFVTICYGDHCLRHDIYKLVSQVEVQDDQPRATERTKDGVGKK